MPNSSMVFIGVTENGAYLSSQEYRHIVRIVGNDIPGEKKILVGLTQIRYWLQFCYCILDSLKINSNTNIGYLSEDEVKGTQILKSFKCKFSHMVS